MTTLVINAIQAYVINDSSYNKIMLYLASSSAFLIFILSIKLIFDSKPYKKWWFTSYFICVLVFTAMVFCFGLWHIFTLGCSSIIIFTILTSFINYKSTEYRARLVALNCIKIKHNIK